MDGHPGHLPLIGAGAGQNPAYRPTHRHHTTKENRSSAQPAATGGRQRAGSRCKKVVFGTTESQVSGRCCPDDHSPVFEFGTRSSLGFLEWQRGLSGSPGDLKLHRSTAARAAPTPPARGAPMPTTAASSSSPTGPRTSEHYGANGNFSGRADQAGVDGFNLADVSSNAQTAALPAGMKGLAWIGSCTGASAPFRSTIRSYVGDPKVFGFYLMDEPDPSVCSAANLKSESDWIHTHDPGTYTFIVETDLSVSNHPTYRGGYNPANSDIDLYGIDSYPCRSENPPSAPCRYSWLALSVIAAEREGIQLAEIVPVYQTFGGGTWVDDEGGSYELPTAAQESKLLSTWAQLVPTQSSTTRTAWGSQNGDRALSSSPSYSRSSWSTTRGRAAISEPHYKLMSQRSNSMAAETAMGVLPDPQARRGPRCFNTLSSG